MNNSVRQYTEINVGGMIELNVAVNEFHNVVAEPTDRLTTDELIGSDGVHLTQKVQPLLGEKVPEVPLKQLPQLNADR